MTAVSHGIDPHPPRKCIHLEVLQWFTDVVEIGKYSESHTLY